jgi:phage shock protein PspC (stress-responsive transcriptional regulator)
MRLTKDKKRGMIFGVCAGISEATGIDVSIVRVATVLGSIFTGSIVFWIYLGLGIVLPLKDD